MTQSKVFRLARRAAAIALAAGMFSGTAGAKVVVGSFDPVYGPAYPGLSFDGKFSVYVPDSCFDASLFTHGNGKYFVADGAPCSQGDANGTNPSVLGNWGGISLLSASVSLYLNAVLQETLNYAVPLLADPTHQSNQTPDPMYGVVVDKTGSDVTVFGINAALLGPLTTSGFYTDDPSATPAPDSFRQRSFSLQLGLGWNNGDIDGSGDDPRGDPNEALEVEKLSDVQAAQFRNANLTDGTHVSEAAAVSIVPEPGSVALVLAALGTLGAVNRRTRSRR